MPPVRSIKNQYCGVNAHLHSLWQATGTWNRFHNYFISKLMEMLKAKLLPMGYTVEIEESLQVRRIGDVGSLRPRPDLLVIDTLPERDNLTASLIRGQTMLLEELEVEDEEHPYTAAVIYELTSDSSDGEAVARMELLSPTNKGNSRHVYTHEAKRRLLLERGLVLVEIDFLHETPPTFERLPDYSQGETGSHPYRILVIDPRPEYDEARVYLHEFDVDMPLPPVDVPLNQGDVVEIDSDKLYSKVFEDGLCGHNLDYSQLPLHFERYSEADQARIANRILAVIEAAQEGRDLEATSLPVGTLSLEAALEQIAVIKG